MNNNERYNSRLASEQKDKLKITTIAVIFLICSVMIFATRYRSDIADMFAGSSVNDSIQNAQNDSVATDEDASVFAEADEENNSENVTIEEASTEGNSEESTDETSEEVTTEEDTEEPAAVEKSKVLEYINTDSPDLSSKADDWYNEDLFVPGNVTDDAYFDTVAIIGDSRTEGLSLYTGMSNLDAFFSKGLNIEKVMTDKVVETEDGTVTVLEALELKDYDNIYISFGLNELGWIYTDVFIEDYKIFIDAVKEVEPDATIYVENILPVSEELSEEDEIYNNPNIRKFNKLLKEMCQEYDDVIYLDVASSVSVNGALPADASTDGRHCNKEYCEKWLDYIRNNVYVKKTDLEE